MAYQQTKVIRIIPDQIGRGGSKTALTTQSINLDIRLANNVFVTYGRWKRSPKSLAMSSTYPSVSSVLQSYALHPYTSFSTTNPAAAATVHLLSHNQLTNGVQEIVRHDGGPTVLKSHAYPGFLDTVPATFLNIKNRCFISWGSTPNFIYTGGVVYDVGVDAPVTAATYTLGGTETGQLFATAGGFQVTFTTGTSTWNNNIKFITIGGVLYPTKQPNPFTSGPYAVGGTLTGTAGSNDIVINNFHFPDKDYNGLLITFTDDLAHSETQYILHYTISGLNTNVHLDTPLTNNATAVSYTLSGDQLTLGKAYTGETTTSIFFETFEGPLSWDTTPPQYAYAYYDSPFFNENGTASGTIATHTITITHDTTPFTRSANWGPLRYVGCTITVGANSYTIASYTPSGLDTIVTTVQALAAGIPALTAYTLSGTMAEYGTGHISNISPVTYVTEQNQGGVSVILSNIIPSRSADQGRFNKIQIFRTQLNGTGATASLYPLDPTIGLIDNVGNVPLSYTDTANDSLVLVAAGFQLPRVSNRKPPAAAHQAYWDGRVFINPVDDPSAIVYSGDLIQITFGVPEESYPSENILRVSSDDGRVTGMSLMGSFVIITTERYAYFVSGTGNGTNAYRLVRFSTMMYGVGDKQMIEFSGATTDDSDLLLYVGKDKKFYLTAPGTGNVSISDPVQDQFNSGIGSSYALIRIANVSINGNHYLIVNNAGQAGNAALYDWDRKVWTTNNASPTTGSPAGMQAMATIYGTSTPVQFLFIYKGAIYEWLGDNETVGDTSAYVQTAPLMGDRKSRKRLEFVRCYVSNMPSQPDTWVCGVGIDERFQTNFFFNKYTASGFDPLYTIQPPGSTPIDNANAQEIILTAPMMQGSIAVEGYRFQVMVVWPGGTSPGLDELYAIDIGYTDLEPEGTTSI